MNAKTKAIVSHLFVIGWLIALIVNSSKKEQLASFYIRQNLGFIVVWVALEVLRILPIVGPVIRVVGGVLLFIGWLMSLIWSIQGEQKPVPWLGEQFQAWFRGF
ncbi:MAG TPA: hypothetical protein PK005_05975 [Bacteroidales bacterium]|jgi:uncharacterized membrane protein|nr:hypothetical protein [Bacteroidales bacterium]MDI9532229.1 hypothetical protein [Bacteroidota bacterium]OPZ57499.1 MAG: hypothetical protein BWY89_00614 [Bacteroidetes bacterium ADurb.BinA012]HRD16374.1 hypothetical protein [Methanothrix soehngenii]MBK7731515.1 hypothetical protein [Bacteroidales bacterium]